MQIVEKPEYSGKAVLCAYNAETPPEKADLCRTVAAQRVAGFQKQIPVKPACRIRESCKPEQSQNPVRHLLTAFSGPN